MPIRMLAKIEENCVNCNTCMEICAQLYFKEPNPLKAALRIIEAENDTDPHHIKTCTQCGKCIEVCPVQAITRAKNGIVRINKKTCVGCLMCVSVCPEEVMFYHDDVNYTFKCIACGACVRACPTEALYIKTVPDE
ncbi:MAG: 4Fe-4S dicluster domain-containing protein [Promethearchaeota archaeon]